MDSLLSGYEGDVNEIFLQDLHKTGIYDLAAAVGIAPSSEPLDPSDQCRGELQPRKDVPQDVPPFVQAEAQQAQQALQAQQPQAPPWVPTSTTSARPDPLVQAQPPSPPDLHAADSAVLACLEAASEAALVVKMARARLAEHGLPQQAQRGEEARAPRAGAAGTPVSQQQQQEGEGKRQRRPRRAATAAAAAAATSDSLLLEQGEEGGAGGGGSSRDVTPMTSPSGKRRRPQRPGISSSPPSQARGPSTGLRQFSLRVCEKVEELGRTSYHQVADELVRDMSEDAAGIDGEGGGGGAGEGRLDEKNIRRRVYDALNVLMAIDVIRKEKKEIVWGGWPQGLSVDPSRSEEGERVRLAARLQEKTSRLERLVAQQSSLSALILRNHDTPMTALPAGIPPGEDPPTPLQLPFMILQAPGAAHVDVQISDDGHLAELDFHSTPFTIYDDESVLRMMRLEASPAELLNRFKRSMRSVDSSPEGE